MNKANRISSTQRQQYWRDHLESCRNSGKSLKAYAVANDLNIGTFYSYSTRFRQSDSSAPGFARAAPEPAPTSLPCRILLPNGVSVELGISAQSVGTVLAMAAKLP